MQQEVEGAGNKRTRCVRMCCVFFFLKSGLEYTIGRKEFVKLNVCGTDRTNVFGVWDHMSIRLSGKSYVCVCEGVVVCLAVQKFVFQNLLRVS